MAEDDQTTPFEVNIPDYSASKPRISSSLSPNTRKMKRTKQLSRVQLEIPLKSDPDDFDSWYSSFDKQIEDLQELVSAQDNLDIYQMNSFYAGLSMRKKYLISYYKTAMVVFIQTAGAIYLAYRQIATHDFKRNFGKPNSACNPGDFSILTWMAFSFCVFISMTLQDQLHEVANYGCYSFKSNLPPFMNRFWLSIGILVNVFVLILSWGVSIIVIFFSNNALDMILNSIAVYFIIELDDELVNFVDYGIIDDFLEFDYVLFMKQRWARIQHQGYESSRWENMGKGILKFVTFTDSKIFNQIITFFAFVVPFYVLICFDGAYDGAKNDVTTTPAPE